jgi:hypothetical protein
MVAEVVIRYKVVDANHFLCVVIVLKLLCFGHIVKFIMENLDILA